MSFVCPVCFICNKETQPEQPSKVNLKYSCQYRPKVLMLPHTTALVIQSIQQKSDYYQQCHLLAIRQGQMQNQTLPNPLSKYSLLPTILQGMINQSVQLIMFYPSLTPLIAIPQVLPCNLNAHLNCGSSRF